MSPHGASFFQPHQPISTTVRTEWSDSARRSLAGTDSASNRRIGCHVLTPSAIASILESPEVRQWGRVPLKWIAPLLKIRQAPVGKLQAVDPTVVAFVVGDQDEILRQGMGSDLGIHVADRVAIDFLASA